MEQCCHGFSYHISCIFIIFLGRFPAGGSFHCKEERSSSSTCRDRPGRPVRPTSGYRGAATAEAKGRSAGAAKLALRLLKVYLFFQIQMWPWWCCFYNENQFQSFQLREPKPPARRSVPVPVLNAGRAPPGPAAKLLRGVWLSRGPGPSAGCLLLSLASADLTSNASTLPPSIFLQ